MKVMPVRDAYSILKPSLVGNVEVIEDFRTPWSGCDDEILAMDYFERLVALDGVSDLDSGEVFVGRTYGAVDDVVECKVDAELLACCEEPCSQLLRVTGIALASMSEVE